MVHTAVIDVGIEGLPDCQTSALRHCEKGDGKKLSVGIEREGMILA